MPINPSEQAAAGSTDRVLRQVRMTTAHVAAREQFAYWRDGFRGARFGLGSEPLAPVNCGFRAEGEAWIAPSVARFRCSAENLLVYRGRRELACREWNSIWIYHQQGPGARYARNGREFDAVAGDLVVTDADQSFAIRAEHAYCHDVWMLPKSLVTPHLRPSDRPFWACLSGGAGLAALLAAFLQSLAHYMKDLPPGQLDAAADYLARLIALVGGARTAEHREAARAALQQRARQHIAQHLAEPGLRPAGAAAALGVSERTLHLAFEGSSVSFAEEVLRRRLAECRAALASSSHAHRSVADIALGWGFESLATFYRAYRRAYGESPGDRRRTVNRA